MDWDKTRELFPILKSHVYFMTQALAPLATPVAKAMRCYLEALEEKGILEEGRDFVIVEGARKSAADLLGAQPEEIALARNTSEGLLWFAVSYPWQRGDEVVVVRGDYPSVVYPWLAQSSRGIAVRFIERDEDRITPGVIEKALTPRTRVVALSFVQFDSGFRADLGAISTACRARGALLVVDATQGLGALPLRVGELGVDALSAGGYKWLLGVKGSGVFFIRQEILAMLRPLHSGFGSMTHWSKPDFSSTDYPFDLVPGARRFEEGTPNVLGLVALEASLRLLAQIGAARIAGRIRELTDFFVHALEGSGHKVLSPRGDEEWSGIVRFRPAKGDVEGWVERLLDERVLINARGDCLQAGLHFYNNFEEVERVVALLSSKP